MFAKSQVPTKIETQQNYLYFFIEIYNCLAVSMIKTIISYKSSKEKFKKIGSDPKTKRKNDPTTLITRVILKLQFEKPAISEVIVTISY